MKNAHRPKLKLLTTKGLERIVDEALDTLEKVGVFVENDEALEQLRKEKPDLLCLDLSMPGKDGGEVFEALRRDPNLEQTRVLIITGKPELRRLIYGRKVAPPEGYLNKPVDEETLILNVRKILELADDED